MMPRLGVGTTLTGAGKAIKFDRVGVTKIIVVVIARERLSLVREVDRGKSQAATKNKVTQVKGMDISTLE